MSRLDDVEHILLKVAVRASYYPMNPTNNLVSLSSDSDEYLIIILVDEIKPSDWLKIKPSDWLLATVL